MKKQLLAAFALCIATAAQAQITTLTAATHMPQVGRGHYMAFLDTSANPSLPDTGANMTWNYAGVIPNGFDTVDYFNCNAQTNCSSFGNATLVSGSPADTFYQYYKTASSGNIFQTTGAVTTQFTVRFTNPVDLYRYPFTYGTRFTDVGNGTASASISPLPLTVTANDTVVGIGYGTLITPVGTFQNVLQVRSAVTTDATLLLQNAATLRTVTYEWYEDSSRFPVMTITYSTTTVQGQTTDFVVGTYRIPTPAAVSTIAAAENFKLAPNPSLGTTRVDVPTSFSTKEATVIITDLTGKMVYNQALNGANAISISTEGWAKGLYLVRLQNGEGITLMNKLSVQ